MTNKLTLTFRKKGGTGSGHRGHAGRPGKRGGSTPGGGGSVSGGEGEQKWPSEIRKAARRKPTGGSSYFDWVDLEARSGGVDLRSVPNGIRLSSRGEKRGLPKHGSVVAIRKIERDTFTLSQNQKKYASGSQIAMQALVDQREYRSAG